MAVFHPAGNDQKECLGQSSVVSDSAGFPDGQDAEKMFQLKGPFGQGTLDIIAL